jgi:hypothetical protein
LTDLEGRSRLRATANLICPKCRRELPVETFGDKSFAILLVPLLSVSMLLEDGLIARAGILVAATAIASELALGGAALHGISAIL